ncbi:MAG: TrkA C-terminal domain-containing protein, partial [Candidatus Krumholzibacteria bacterium]|nr:TrkA C-terminal domain-containing protein [Candidatus Krumholzibacteria bacterium]
PGAVKKPLRELALPARTNLMVVAVVHADGKRSFNPPPDIKLDAGDELIVIGPQGGVSKMVELYGAA